MNSDVRAERGERARLRRWTGAVAAVALIAVGGSACRQPEPPAPVSSRASSSPASVRARVVEVRYEAPGPADRRDAGFLRARKTAETAATDLAEFLAWGGRAPVPLVVKSCGGEGPSYDPESRRIEICYEEVAETRALFREDGRTATDAEVNSVLLESLFHESGHALVDALGLKLPGPSGLPAGEEDTADRFAALMLLRRGEAGERQLRAAAEVWRISAEVYEEAPDEDEPDEEAPDEHPPDRERAVNQLCYAYGAGREAGRNQDLVGAGGLPEARAAGCVKEWDAARASWTQALKASGALA